MRDTVYTSDLVSIVSPNRQTIEKWVSMGFLTPVHEPEGRRGRKWTFGEAMRIETIYRGLKLGVSRDHMKRAVESLHSWRDEPALLLIGIAHHSPEGIIDHWNCRSKVARETKVLEAMTELNCEAYAVIPLQPIEDKIAKGFAD